MDPEPSKQFFLIIFKKNSTKLIYDKLTFSENLFICVNSYIIKGVVSLLENLLSLF